MLVLAVAALYSQRGPIGARLAMDYLAARGVPATLRIERLGPKGVVASAVMGPPGDPDLTIEQMEIEFEPFPLVRDGLLSPRVRIIRLTRPRLKATWRDGRLSFGTLQRVIEEFLAKPAVGPPPSVAIQGGELRVLTEAGVVQVAGEAAIDKGRIARVDARMGPQRLARPGWRAELQSARLRLGGQGGRLTAQIEAAAPLLQQGEAVARDVTLALVGDLPYGAEPATLFDGRFGLRGTATAQLASGESALRDANIAMAFSGAARGPADRLALSGGGTLGLQAAALSGPTAAAAPRLSAALRDFSLTRAGDRTSFGGLVQLAGGATSADTGAAGLRDVDLRGEAARLQGVAHAGRVTVSAAPSLTLTAARVSAGETQGQGLGLALSSSRADWSSDAQGWRIAGPVETRAGLARLDLGQVVLNAVALEGRGEGQAGAGGTRLSWRGSARSRSGTSAAQAEELASAFAAVVPDQAALATALRTARLDAPELRIDTAAGRLQFALGAPVRLTGEGAAIGLAPREGMVIATLADDGLTGSLRLASSGAAVPNVTLDLVRYRLGAAGLNAEARFNLANMDVGVLRGIKVAAAGTIAPRGAGHVFTSAECATATAERIVGEDAVPATDLAASLCADRGRPLLSFTPRGWNAHARFVDAHVLMPPAEVALVDTLGLIDIGGGPAGLTSGLVRVDGAVFVDRASETRFRSVFTSGEATLGGDSWAGELTLADAEEKRRLGIVRFSHAMSTARGFAEIDARNLAFTEEGLQPMDISPIAIGMMTQAEGPADFFGRIDWDTAGVKSSGRIATAGLDFNSSFGRVTGMKGEVVFTSLAPLTTEVDQGLTVDHVDWLVPLDDAALRLSLTPTEIKVTRAEVAVGGGKAVLDPLDLKLGAMLPTSGTLRLTGIDINNLLSNFDIAEKVQIEAVVDGVLPFAFTPEGLRFADGKLFAVAPGRVSIKREALTGVAASGEAASGEAGAAQPNAMQSFAYQAMENLSFTQLDAGVNSLPQGRLGVVFHVNGRHDPPARQTARVPILDLLRGRAFDKEIPLPSGTPVELTLDTSLNFDELVAAYSNAGRSTPIQP